MTHKVAGTFESGPNETVLLHGVFEPIGTTLQCRTGHTELGKLSAQKEKILAYLMIPNDQNVKHSKMKQYVIRAFKARIEAARKVSSTCLFFRAARLTSASPCKEAFAKWPGVLWLSTGCHYATASGRGNA